MNTVSRIAETKVLFIAQNYPDFAKSCHVYTIKRNEKEKLFSVYDTQHTHIVFKNKMSKSDCRMIL